MRCTAALGSIAVIALLPTAAAAQALHAFGPPGNGQERRVVVIYENEDGTCASLDDVQLEIDGGASLDVGDAAGACARWIEVTRTTGEGTLTLRATSGDSRSEVSLEMAAAPLVVSAERTGDAVRVDVAGVSALEALHVAAAWSGGATVFQRDAHGYTGQVPPDAMVGIVVSVGERSGATALPPLVRSGHAELLLVPSSLVVASGGASRTAAYLFVADGQARLSRSLPLQVASERGALRALDWLAPGVAAIALAAPIGVRSVDLGVATGPIRVEAELEAGAAWPMAATIDAPVEVVRGGVATITVAATSADDEPVDPTSLVVRCGELELVPEAAGVVECPISSETRVIVRARIAGSSVPLASRTIRLAEPMVEVRPEPDAARPDAVAAEPTPDATPLRVAALLQGAVDIWARGTFGAGGSLRVPVDRAIAIELAVRYQLTVLSYAGRGLVQGSLSGLAHGGEVTGGARFSPFSDVPLELLAAAGLAIRHTSATIDTTTIESDDVDGVLLLAVGTTFDAGGVSLGIDAYGRASVPFDEVTWDEPILRFGVEITAGLDVTP